MNKPKVSIVVPIYNVVKYLDRCIQSLLAQTLKEIEIILVDDESPDNCPQICDRYVAKYTYVKVVHKKNDGLGKARNSGMEVATGEYIAFVDSDDFIDADMMERLYDECKEHSLDVIYSEFNVDEYPGFRITLKPERLYTGREEIEQLRLDIVGAEPNHRSSVKFQCSACKGLYSMKLLSEHHLQFHSERQYISEDMLFNLDVLYHAMQVKTVPWQMYHYCLNGASLSHTYRPDRWPKLLYMLEILDKKGQQFKHQEEFRLRLARTAIFYTRSGIGQEIRRTDISFKEKLRRVTEIMKDTTISSLIKDYPFYNLPLTWKIYGYLLKCKCKWIMFIVMYINNKKRRMTSIKIC